MSILMLLVLELKANNKTKNKKIWSILILKNQNHQ